MGSGWRNFEACDKNCLDCFEVIVGRNMDAKGYCGEGSEESEEHCRKSFYHLKEYLCHPGPNVGRNMNIKGASDEVSDGMRSILLETGGKAILFLKWEKSWMNCVLLLGGKQKL